ncbi:MAG: hydroxylamine reductase, partial [Candidatus Omnitrophota bacterium]
MKMFCNQCEQTFGGMGCTVKGVCGKDSETALLQDLLIFALKGIAVYGYRVRPLGIIDTECDHFISEGLFSTVTNVNFDRQRLRELINKAYELKEKMKLKFLKEYRKNYGKEFADQLPELVNWIPADNIEGLINHAKDVGVAVEEGVNQDIISLREILLFGLKGMAAYCDHAFILGYQDEEVSFFFYKGLDALADNSLSTDDLLALIMEFGKVNLRCLELLDKAHNNHFGSPALKKVSLGVKKGPAIIVSGHDLYDLKQLLEQTEGKGINVYTHGEMLPAHGYPELNKYPHLAGHFGTAWQNQHREFDAVPAGILFTTNCIQKPKDSYKDRVFTTGLVAWPQVKHIYADSGKKDFTPLINKALSLGGFDSDNIEKEITVGFGHNMVLTLADKIIEAVKSGKIKHFFL